MVAVEADCRRVDDRVLYYPFNDSALANGTFVDPGTTAPLLHHSIPTLVNTCGRFSLSRASASCFSALHTPFTQFGYADRYFLSVERIIFRIDHEDKEFSW